MQLLRNWGRKQKKLGEEKKKGNKCAYSFLKKNRGERGGSSYFIDSKISLLEQLNKQKLVF